MEVVLFRIQRQERRVALYLTSDLLGRRPENVPAVSAKQAAVDEKGGGSGIVEPLQRIWPAALGLNNFSRFASKTNTIVQKKKKKRLT